MVVGMSKIQHELTIGALAKATEVGVETVRYYQRIGLIDEPKKPLHGFRRYPSNTVSRIKFIKRAQRLGFSLLEITDLLDLGSGHCHDVKIRAEEKCNFVEKQIRDLTRLRDTLKQMIKECNSTKDDSYCPMIEALLAPDA